MNEGYWRVTLRARSLKILASTMTLVLSTRRGVRGLRRAGELLAELVDVRRRREARGDGEFGAVLNERRVRLATSELSRDEGRRLGRDWICLAAFFSLSRSCLARSSARCRRCSVTYASPSSAYFFTFLSVSEPASPCT